LHLAPDVRGDLAAQVTLDLVVGLDVVADRDDLLVREVLGPLARVDTGRGERFLRPGATDPEDVGERDLHPLVAGEVDADDTCHVWAYSSWSRRSLPVPSGPCPWSGPGLRPGVCRVTPAGTSLRCSALTLLVPRVGADHNYPPVTADHPALVADLLDDRLDLHGLFLTPVSPPM